MARVLVRTGKDKGSGRRNCRHPFSTGFTSICGAAEAGAADDVPWGEVSCGVWVCGVPEAGAVARRIRTGRKRPYRQSEGSLAYEERSAWWA